MRRARSTAHFGAAGSHDAAGRYARPRATPGDARRLSFEHTFARDATWALMPLRASAPLRLRRRRQARPDAYRRIARAAIIGHQCHCTAARRLPRRARRTAERRRKIAGALAAGRQRRRRDDVARQPRRHMKMPRLFAHAAKKPFIVCRGAGHAQRLYFRHYHIFRARPRCFFSFDDDGHAR